MAMWHQLALRSVAVPEPPGSSTGAGQLRGRLRQMGARAVAVATALGSVCVTTVLALTVGAATVLYLASVLEHTGARRLAMALAPPAAPAAARVPVAPPLIAVTRPADVPAPAVPAAEVPAVPAAEVPAVLAPVPEEAAPLTADDQIDAAAAAGISDDPGPSAADVSGEAPAAPAVAVDDAPDARASRSAEDALRRFYALLDGRDFAGAYDLLSGTVRAQYARPRFDQEWAGMRTVRPVAVGASGNPGGGGAVRLDACRLIVRAGPQGDVAVLSRGTVTMVAEGGGYRVGPSDLRPVGGC